MTGSSTTSKILKDSPAPMAILFLLLVFCAAGYAQSICTLSGLVVDSKTNVPIASASVRISQTTTGTITNMDGSYLLPIPAGRYTVIYSFVGYVSDSITVRLAGNMNEDIRLEPVEILLPEVMSIAEDPAYAIIRKAIAKKHEQEKILLSYSFKAFTRGIIYRDTSLAAIMESYTDGYWRKGDSLHEVVVQKRETKNLPEAGFIPSVGESINFTDDLIPFIGYKFIGPVADDALDYYKYKLLKTFRKSDVDIYEIEVIPESRIIPLFSGKISVADSSYAVMGVDLKPNESFRVPFVSGLRVEFKQHYSRYDGRFWMPTDMITDFGLKIQFAGMSLPRLVMNETSDIYEYNLNPPIADSIFAKPVLVVDSSSTKFDSTFWASNEVLPLTAEEEKGYKTLDSTETLQKLFKPTGATASIFGENGVLSYFKYTDIRFDRVEGLFLGGKYSYMIGKKLETLRLSNDGSDFSRTSTGLQLEAAAGYGFSDRLAKWRMGADYSGGSKVGQEIGAGFYRDISHYPNDNFFSPLTTTVTSLIGRNDYYNYYMAYGWEAHYGLKPFSKLDASVTYLSENETSVVNHTNFSILALGGNYRTNPPISQGEMRSLEFHLRYGDDPAPLGIIPVDAADLEGEYSSPSKLASAFNFGRYTFLVSYHFATFLQSYLFPPQTQIMISAGASTGTLPVQREFVLDSQIGGLAPFGVLKTARPVEFIGDRYLIISAEQNFRGIPFLLLDIPFLYKSGIEILVDGSAAQSWLNGVSTTDGWYYEAGIGLGKILGLFRMDFTYRISKPNALFFSIGASTLL